MLFRSQHEQVFLGRDFNRDRDFSEEVAWAIDKEIRSTVEKSYKQAEELITNNRSKLQLIANALLEHETLDMEEITALMEGKDLVALHADRKAKKQATLERSQESKDFRATGRETVYKKESVQVLINEKKIAPESTNKDS